VSDEKAVWRSEFPVAWAEDDLVTRRAFTRSLAGLSCASFAATAAVAARQAGAPDRAAWPSLALPEADGLAVGTSRVFDYPEPGHPCLLIRTGADSYAAYAQRCTHLGCPVIYRPRSRDLQCPCHEGYFSVADGRVLAGPPPRPLPRVELVRREGVLTAIGVRP
jgi:Rieske Fe-S protein